MGAFKKLLTCRCSRRNFIRGLTGFVATAGISKAFAGDTDGTMNIPLEKIPPLNTVGEGVLLKLKGKKVLLIRTGEASITALNPTCRHKECDVLFKSEWKEIRCDCHGSKYDLYGSVTEPPSKANLWAYKVELVDGIIKLDLETATDQR